MANVTTELGVANLALQRIGVKASTDLAGTDKKSVAANRILSDTRDEVQRMFPWNCLINRQVLSTGTAGTSSFSYIHTLGATCLRVLEVLDSADDYAENIPYRREGDYLYTDQKTGYVRYIKQTTNITPWDPFLLSAIESRMASKLAVWLTGKIALGQVMHQDFMQTISLAINVRAMEGKFEDNRKLLAMLDMQYVPLLASDKRISE